MSILNPKIHVNVLLVILSLVLLTISSAQAGNAHYKKHGVAFDYSKKYQLTEGKTKHGWTLQLKNGPNSILINLYPNALIDGFADLVSGSIAKGFVKQGRAVDNVHREEISLPLKVDGVDKPVEVDAIKYSHTVKVTKEEMKLNIKQTLFFFSHADYGYMINFTRVNAPDEHIDTLLSSLTLDQ